MLSASPQHNDAAVKAITEPRNILRRPYRSLSLPLIGSISTNPNEYAVMVHPAQLIDVCNPCCKECNAVATIVESTDIISNASATIVKTSARRTGRLSPGGLKNPSVPRTSCRTLIFRLISADGDSSPATSARSGMPEPAEGAIGALNVSLLRRCLGRDLHRDARLAGEQARD